MESIGLILILVVMIAMMYFSTRQNKKKQQEVADFRSHVKAGDEVMTGSGLLGKVISVNAEDNSIIIESEGTKSRWLQDAITRRPEVIAPVEIPDADGIYPSERKALEEKPAKTAPKTVAPKKSPAKKVPASKAQDGKKVAAPVAKKAPAKKTPAKSTAKKATK